MKRVFAVTAVFALLCLCAAAQADVFNMGEGLTNLETVTVGDPGNVGELSGLGAGGFGPNRICGAVNYVYNIGKYEVTTAQYCDFLNHKAVDDPYHLWTNQGALHDPDLQACNIQCHGYPGGFWYTVGDGSSQDVAAWGNRPVNWTTYWNVLRFANWVNNGQGDGDTETGAYTLHEYMGEDGRTIQRNAGAKWFLTSEDEWYKAAYYKGGGTNAGYWVFATQSVYPPDNIIWPIDPGNSANHQPEYPPITFTLGAPYWRTNVEEFENSASAYGTFDQNGNVWEWNESIVYKNPYYVYRGLRGGSYVYSVDNNVPELEASSRQANVPCEYHPNVGFRVATVPAGWAPILAINNKAVYDPIMDIASAKYKFIVFGRVMILESGNSFTVDDGSGMPVKVVAPGFSGIQNGDYACASGWFSGQGSNRVLNAQASDVMKLH